MRKYSIIIYLMICLGVGRGFAQENPQDIAAVVYELILNATPETYGALGAYVCGGNSDYTPALWQNLVLARGDESIDISGLTFTPLFVSANQSAAVIEIGGETNFSGELTLPQYVEMVNDGGWKICRQDRPIRMINPADLALDEDAAREVALQFYAGFYTNRAEILDATVCEAWRDPLKRAADENYGAADILPTSQWDFQLVPQGNALLVQTQGDLILQRLEDNALLTLNDRADFPVPRLVRENGWKFCTPYRAGETLIRDFVQGYYGGADETWDQLVCESYRPFLMAQVQQLDISVISLPNAVFADQDVLDREGQAINLQAVVVIGAGGEVVSVGDEFGTSARLIQTPYGDWQWCQLPLAFFQTQSER